MRIIPKTNTLRKTILIYRSIRHRNGHGVHSPFVFNLITKVIEEKRPYYTFHDIELLRKQLIYKEEKITYPDRHHKGKLRTRSISKIVAQEGIKPKHGALLFRLANYFKPRSILHIGPSMGLSALYLSSYQTGANCIALEHIEEFATISRWIYERAGRNPVSLQVGAYQNTLPPVLTSLNQLDLVYFNTATETFENEWLFTTCLKYIHDQTVFVIKGIKSNKEMRAFWSAVTGRPKVTVTIDLYSMGLVFFNRKLHKRNYKTYF
ncbi:MAG: SAM-dependent methyltransferase [Tannerellaceae bacterium]|nr:SAM-dependent methyltransferase [Tannerellaceae bacterium]